MNKQTVCMLLAITLSAFMGGYFFIMSTGGFHHG